MTAGSLRDLAAKATPGPWAVMSGFSTKQVRTDDYHLAIVAETLRAAYPENAEGDARLIALAPDLAVLCADMADALAVYADTDSWDDVTRQSDDVATFEWCGDDGEELPWTKPSALLARFRALEKGHA